MWDQTSDYLDEAYFKAKEERERKAKKQRESKMPEKVDWEIIPPRDGGLMWKD